MRGPAIERYEAEFARRTGVAAACTFAAARVGLYGVLRALEIREGDEVLVPLPTHVVVANAVRYTGARPRYVDCRPGDYNIDLERAEASINGRTRAIILQHTFGVPVDLDAALALADARGLVVIEDCVHALGATYRGRPVGSFGAAAVFSTEETKVISSTMGGVAVTGDATLAHRLRKFQQQCEWPSGHLVARYLVKLIAYAGLTEPGAHFYARRVYERLGRRNPLPQPTSVEEQRGLRPPRYERRLANGQAAVALAQLRRLDENIAHRRAVAEVYRDRLEAAGLRGLDGVPAHAGPAYLRYPVWVEDRDEAVRRLARRAVVGLWFRSVLSESRDPSDAGYEPGSCPQAEAAARHLINLPTHPRVTTQDAADLVALLAGRGLRRPSLAASAASRR